jgi:hypothetical protein
MRKCIAIVCLNGTLRDKLDDRAERKFDVMQKVGAPMQALCILYDRGAGAGEVAKAATLSGRASNRYCRRYVA